MNAHARRFLLGDLPLYRGRDALDAVIEAGTAGDGVGHALGRIVRRPHCKRRTPCLGRALLRDVRELVREQLVAG